MKEIKQESKMKQKKVPVQTYVLKEEREKFSAYCTSQGLSSSEVLRSIIVRLSKKVKL
jgi:hypothetical protein